MRFVILAALVLSISLATAGSSLGNGIQGHISSLDPILQERVQQALKDEGFDPGPIDGDFGKRSERALMDYRRTNDLLEDTDEMQGIEDVLTPKLALELLGIEIIPGENGVELGDDEQLAVLRQLGLLPSADYWAERGQFPD